MVATDSYRLAVKETALEGGPPEDVEAIVPVKALNEVARLAAGGDGDIGVAVTRTRLSSVWATCGSRRDSSTGSSPTTDSFFRRVSITRSPWTATPSVARRVSLLAQKNAPLRLTFTPGTLTMRAVTQDIGQAEEELDVEFDGEEFEIGFNPLYLIDGVDGVDGERVGLKFINPLRPGLVSGEDGGFQYLIMPIRLSS